MNISSIIQQLSFLFNLIPYKIYNQLTNDSYVVLHINDNKSYQLKYNATHNIHLLVFNNDSFKQNIFAY
jgi:hypothetical protein